MSGVGLAFMAEILDDTVRTGEDLRKLTNIHCLPAVPRMRRARGAAERLREVALHPQSAPSEAIRAVRVSLDIACPALSGKSRVFLVTSAQPVEGKTTISLNLALSFLSSERKVLWVSADMRHPVDLTGLDIPAGTEGLAEHLAGQCAAPPAFAALSNPRFHILSSSKAVKDAGELLSNARVEQLIHWARANYDIIVLDSPPVLLVSDALALSSHCDYGLLVVSAGKTGRGLVLHACELLQQTGIRVAGAVLNDVTGRGERFSGRYGYGYGYHSGYGYGRGYYSSSDKRDTSAAS
jgi:capsular exopolysaccharide synthesis family protein